jgi:hypothetical protein
VATTRSTQAHDKRVQQIADEAAAKIAADSPIEEEVVVVVEERPPGESNRTRRGRTAEPEQEATSAAFSMVGQTQKVIADGVNRWTELAAPFIAGDVSPGLLSGAFDPNQMTREVFRLAEELLELQKDFALKILDAMIPTRTAA